MKSVQVLGKGAVLSKLRRRFGVLTDPVTPDHVVVISDSLRLGHGSTHYCWQCLRESWEK